MSVRIRVSRTLATLLSLGLLFAVVVVIGDAQLAGHQGIPAGSAPPPASPSGACERWAASPQASSQAVASPAPSSTCLFVG